MIKTTSIDSLTNFQKNVKTYVGKLGQSKEPLVLTVNGQAKLVVQDAEAYQAMLNELERSRFLEAVREGIIEANNGESKSAEAVYERMRAKYDL
jgi:PHD/YefM family antitoxin component YafN of YafNO toxin-antitoxin module